MTWHTIWVLVRKDLALYGRQRFFALISLALLVAYVVGYHMLPASVDSRFKLALASAALPDSFYAAFQSRNMDLTLFENSEALKAAVSSGEYRVGLELDPATVAALEAGESTTIMAYYPPGVPSELNAAFTNLLTIILNDLSYTANQQPLQIERHEHVLGYDLAGATIAPRDRLMPIFVMVVLLMDMLSIAHLITEEVQHKTLRALLITPLRIREFWSSKWLTSLLIGLTQACILLALTGKLVSNLAPLIITLLLGVLLITGIAMVIAAVARDMLSVISWGTLGIMILGFPAATIMFPGMIPDLVRAIPSFYLIDTLHRILNFAAPISAVWGNLLVLSGWSCGLALLGAALFRRRLV